MKIAVIGGGSSYTPELIEGLALWSASGGPREVALFDVDRKRAEIVAGFSGRMARHLHSSLKVSVASDLDEAIENAAFVVLQIRVGGQLERHNDIVMGLEQDLIGQETTGVGGFAKALRTIPVVLDIARRVRDQVPKAWIVNFTNPSGIITEAICRFATTRCVGLCNVPKEFQMDVARHLRLGADEVQLDWVGLNHLGWARKIIVNGRDVLPHLLQTLDSGYGPKNIPDLEYPEGFLSALGMLPSSYCRYYYLPDLMLKELKGRKKSRAEEVMAIEEDLFKYYEDVSNSMKPVALTERGGAWYSRIAVEVMEALESESPRNLIVNTANLGAIEGLPGDASVEVPAMVSRDGVKPIMIGEVEEAIMGLIRQVKSYERLTIEAAIGRDKKKALLALMANPLVGSAEQALKVLASIQSRGIL
jgi:6-phospho-beta-glucosidase